jgi:hypothetical protein
VRSNSCAVGIRQSWTAFSKRFMAVASSPQAGCDT